MQGVMKNMEERVIHFLEGVGQIQENFKVNSDITHWETNRNLPGSWRQGILGRETSISRGGDVYELCRQWWSIWWGKSVGCVESYRSG